MDKTSTNINCLANIKQFASNLCDRTDCASFATITNIEHKLLHRALSESKALSLRELIQKTPIDQFYIRQWLLNGVANGYVLHDSHSRKYSLSQESQSHKIDINRQQGLNSSLEVDTSIWLANHKATEVTIYGDEIKTTVKTLYEHYSLT